MPKLSTRTVDIVQSVKVTKQVTFEFPVYSMLWVGDYEVFYRTDADLTGWEITIRDDCITDSGYHQNMSVDIEHDTEMGTGALPFEGGEIRLATKDEFAAALKTAREFLAKIGDDEADV